MSSNRVYPDWVYSCSRPSGTGVRKVNNRYYVYEQTCYYDKETKKPKKKTGQILGVITEKDGFVESKTAKLRRQASQAAPHVQVVKEYGLSEFIRVYIADTFFVKLKECFPDCWEMIAAMAYCVLRYNSPLKSMSVDYEESYLSTYMPVNLEKKQTQQIH